MTLVRQAAANEIAVPSGAEYEPWIDERRTDYWTMAGWITVVIMTCCIVLGQPTLWNSALGGGAFGYENRFSSSECFVSVPSLTDSCSTVVHKHFPVALTLAMTHHFNATRANVSRARAQTCISASSSPFPLVSVARQWNCLEPLLGASHLGFDPDSSRGVIVWWCDRQTVVDGTRVLWSGRAFLVSEDTRQERKNPQK